MTKIKASFDDYYKVYSPQPYTERIVDEMGYRLPFTTAHLLKEYLQDHQATLKTSILGSSHGLDAVALKYNYTPQDILKYWLHGEPTEHHFQGGDSRFKITMIDQYEPPLQFAQDVGLCESFYTCNLVQDWPQDLLNTVNYETDLLLCIGVTTYLGEEVFHEIVQLVEKSQIQYFCFSVVSYVRDAYVTCFKGSNLNLHHLGRTRQRDYANQNEQQKTIDFLRSHNIYSPDDEACLMTSIYVVHK